MYIRFTRTRDHVKNLFFNRGFPAERAESGKFLRETRLLKAQWKVTILTIATENALHKMFRNFISTATRHDCRGYIGKIKKKKNQPENLYILCIVQNVLYIDI